MSDADALRERIDALEMRLTYQDVTIETLNQTITAQWQHIDALTRQLAELRERLRFVQFAGEWRTFGQLLNGPVRDFNLIVRRTSLRAEIWHRPLVGPMVFLAEAGVSWFVFVAAGSAQIKNRSDAAALEGGDSLLLDADGAAENVVLTGGGELVIVKLTRLATTS